MTWSRSDILRCIGETCIGKPKAIVGLVIWVSPAGRAMYDRDFLEKIFELLGGDRREFDESLKNATPDDRLAMANERFLAQHYDADDLAFDTETHEPFRAIYWNKTSKAFGRRELASFFEAVRRRQAWQDGDGDAD